MKLPKKPFVLYVGSLYPHKNVISLVKAAKKLEIALVVVSARNVFLKKLQKQVKKAGAENLVTFTGFIPDKKLKSLYQQAAVFVFPSLLEGFGLPGLEAMAAGCPVLASNSSCLPEIYGQAALYFNPLDIDQMAAKIKAVIEKPRLAAKLRRLGRRQVKKYSWAKTARETIKVYEECCLAVS